MAVVSSSIEIDSVFIKALKLLHSKHPDSLDQLRALRDDVTRQHNQQVPATFKVRDSLRLSQISCIFTTLTTLKDIKLTRISVKQILQVVN